MSIGISSEVLVGGTQTVTGSVSVSNLPATQPVSGTLTVVSAFSTRSDTYTTTSSGTTVNVTTTPLTYYSVQVKGTGASATTWDVRLEGSLDGTNFSQIIAHTNTDTDGSVKWLGASYVPSLYIRSRCAGLVLGSASNIVVTLLGIS